MSAVTGVSGSNISSKNETQATVHPFIPAVAEAIQNLAADVQLPHPPLNQRAIPQYPHLVQAKTAFEKISKYNVLQGPGSNLTETVLHPQVNEVPLPAVVQVRGAKAVMSHLEDLMENISAFKQWLGTQGLEATAVSGTGLNCLINALIQHATGEYLQESFKRAQRIRSKIDTEFPNLLDMLHDDDVRTKRVVELVNQEYKLQLAVYFIQANEEGLPAITSVINGEQQQPVVIWQQGGHYVAITTSNQLTSMRVRAAVHTRTGNSDTNDGGPSAASSAETEGLSEEELYYQRIRESINKREWTEEALTVNIPPHKRDRFQHYAEQIKGKIITFPPIKVTIEEVLEDGITMRSDEGPNYKDPRVYFWMILALDVLIKKDDHEFAEVILNQLHGLDVDLFLHTEAKKFETGKKFRQAEHYYHALTLMHPFNPLLYEKRAELFFHLGSVEKSIIICKEGLKKIKNPKERQFLEFKIVSVVLRSKKGISLPINEAQKFLSTCFKMQETMHVNQELSSFFVKLLSKLLASYTKQCGFHDRESFRVLFEYTQKLLMLVNTDHPEMQQMRQHWAEQLMELLYHCETNDKEGPHSKKSSLKSMAMQFRQYPRIVQIYYVWCQNNDSLEEFIRYYDESLPLDQSAVGYYYQAKAIVAANANEPPEVIEKYLRESHKHAQTAWSAFNIGSLLLTVRRSPDRKQELQQAEPFLPLLLMQIEASRCIYRDCGLVSCYWTGF